MTHLREYTNQPISRDALVREIASAVVSEASLVSSFGKGVAADRVAKAFTLSKPALIRSMPDRPQLSASEKKAHGVNPRSKIDQEFWDALSDEGRADPIAATDYLWHRTLCIVSTVETVLRMRDAGIDAVEFRASGSLQQCAAATDHDREVIPLADLAQWPPRWCGAAWCNCILTPVI